MKMCPSTEGVKNEREKAQNKRKCGKLLTNNMALLVPPYTSTGTGRSLGGNVLSYSPQKNHNFESHLISPVLTLHVTLIRWVAMCSEWEASPFHCWSIFPIPTYAFRNFVFCLSFVLLS